MSTIRQMVKDINVVRDQLKPENLDYYDDVIVYVRDARIEREAGEELLLEMGHHLLDAQKKGKTAKQLFGKESIEYGNMLVRNLPEKRQLSKPMYYLMIPWIALTWVFLIQALMGLFKISISDSGIVGQINVATLIIVAVGSIALVEMLTRFTDQPVEKSDTTKPGMQINARSVLTYLVILILIFGVGIFLREVMPVITIAPWVSLLLFVIGVVGQKFIFMRK